MASPAPIQSSGQHGAAPQQQQQLSACPEGTHNRCNKLKEARREDAGGVLTSSSAATPEPAPAPAAAGRCSATREHQPPPAISEDAIIEVASPVCYAGEFTEYTGLAPH